MGCFRFRSRAESLSAAMAKATYKPPPLTASPLYSFDEQVEHDLREWGRLSEYGLCLVHTLCLSGFRAGALSVAKAQDVFKTWDVISTSLVIRRRVWAQSFIRRNRAGFVQISSQPTPMFHSVGFILDVPPENILGTFSRDVLFPTHASPEGYEFSDTVLHGFEHNTMWAGGFRHIEPPFEILHHTRSQGPFSDYNEVLVVTRPCAKIHFSMTKEVKVTGILYSPSNRGADPADDITLLHALLALNPELDIELA